MATYSGGGDPDRRSVVLRGHRDARLISIRKAVDSAVQRRRFVVTSAGPTSSSSNTKVVLQKDFLNVAAAPTSGVESTVTRDADGGMRVYSPGRSEVFDEAVWDCDGGLGDWNTSLNGAGSSAYTGATDHIGGSLKADGEWGMSVGTTSTGRAAFYRAPFTAFGNGTAYEFESRLTNGAASTAGEEFHLTVGFGDNFTASGQPVDGAYFIYRRDVDGDFWVCVTRSNSVETKTVTTVAPGGYAAMTKFKINVNADGTSVVFTINGTVVATHSTNIPTGSSRTTGLGLKMEKFVGTAQRWSYVDYFVLRRVRTSAR